MADGARTALATGLDRIARRLTTARLLRGVAGGALAAVAVVAGARIVGTPLPAAALAAIALVCGGGGGGVALLRGRQAGGTRRAAALRVEEHAPDARNLVRTAEELLGRPDAHSAAPDDPAPATPLAQSTRAGVIADAAAFVARLDPADVVSLGRPAALAGASVLLFLAAGVALPGGAPVAHGGEGEPAPPVRLSDADVRATVTLELHPPSWIGGSPRTVADPSRIDVVEGSRVEVAVTVEPAEGAVTAVRLETLEGVRDLVPADAGRFVTSVTARADGFLALEGVDDEGRAHIHHLIGVHVVPDAPPTLEIRLPGRDLRFEHGDQEIEITVEARDDHALAELELVYTRVSGFGELFEFLEGTIPLTIEREAPERWRGQARWSLAPLALERGELAVYHARARDHRPGAPWATSDRWVVEVLGGDAQAAGGFAGEDELTRYAMSQQMVLVLMERLAAARDTLTAEAFLEEARVLAAGQRRVRTEFVFMLGGELEDEAHLSGDGDAPGAAQPDPAVDPDAGLTPPDPAAPADLHEEAHARADQDAAEGRLAQQGRLELSRAVQAMAITATHLQAGQLPPAREAGEVALEHLQRAFSSSRYILRALPEREELDLERRLTGALDEAVPDRRPLPHAPPDAEVATLRAVLADLNSGGTQPLEAGPLLATASTLLGVAPADPDLQGMVRTLRDAASRLDDDPAAAAEGVDEVRRALVDLLRARLVVAPHGTPGREIGWLEGVLLQGGGGEP